LGDLRKHASPYHEDRRGESGGVRLIKLQRSADKKWKTLGKGKKRSSGKGGRFGGRELFFTSLKDPVMQDD